MVSPSDFVDGVAINYRRLAVTIFGAGILAYMEGLVGALLSLVRLPLDLVAGFADFLGSYTLLIGGAPATIIAESFRAAGSWVSSLGIAGYAGAIVVALASLYTLAWVISNVR